MTGPRKLPQGEPRSPRASRGQFPLGVEAEAPRGGRLKLAVVLLLLCAAAAVLPIVLWQRIALAVIAIAGLVRIALSIHRRSGASKLGEIVVDDEGIERRSRRGRVGLASFGESFGLSVFADPRRTRAILAFTTPSSARFVTARLGEAIDAEAERAILERAAAIAESDALGAQLEEATLSASDAETLLAMVERRAPDAVGRLYVSGASGEPVVLDPRALRVGAKVFDLSEPLEWKAFMFHETVGAMAMLYHATWVRQDAAEVVLVSPLPPEVSSLFSEGPEELRAVIERNSEMQRAVAKDLRVMQAAADTPPPVETRVAVERMFMFPLRRALDAAPRARVSVPSFRSSARVGTPSIPGR